MQAVEVAVLVQEAAAMDVDDFVDAITDLEAPVLYPDLRFGEREVASVDIGDAAHDSVSVVSGNTELIVQPQRAEVLGLLVPARAFLDVQEKVNLAVEKLHQFQPRLGADLANAAASGAYKDSF